ncbi:MAG: shikimate kinase AroK [Pseudomonadales bacterium]|nr:shikimate kinase AroK [Pseudomonadales bacterium]
MVRVILVGPMGVGKTTIGKILADELHLPFFDSDKEIESRAGADIPWIFDVEGERGFRERESRILDELTSLNESIVLATGGGIVLSPDNRKRLISRGRVVYLTASLKHLLQRTSRDKKRPLLQTDNPAKVLEAVLEIRDPLYREIAEVIVSTENKNPKHVAKEIIHLLDI